MIHDKFQYLAIGTSGSEEEKFERFRPYIVMPDNLVM